MNHKEFEKMLQAAVSGSHEALEQLFLLYAPLIDKHSKIDGRIDEDLRQYLLIHIALNISKFVI